MYSRFSEAKEITPIEMLEMMKEKEERHLADAEVYGLSMVAISAENTASAQEQATNLMNLYKSKQLQPLIDAEGLVIMDAQGNRIRDAQTLVDSFKDFENMVSVSHIRSVHVLTDSVSSASSCLTAYVKSSNCIGSP